MARYNAKKNATTRKAARKPLAAGDKQQLIRAFYDEIARLSNQRSILEKRAGTGTQAVRNHGEITSLTKKINRITRAIEKRVKPGDSYQ